MDLYTTDLIAYTNNLKPKRKKSSSKFKMSKKHKYSRRRHRGG